MRLGDCVIGEGALDTHAIRITLGDRHPLLQVDHALGIHFTLHSRLSGHKLRQGIAADVDEISVLRLCDLLFLTKTLDSHLQRVTPSGLRHDAGYALHSTPRFHNHDLSVQITRGMDVVC